jgi:cell division ATPase FtsA
METTLLKKKFNTGFSGNEENGYPVPDLNTMINVTKEPTDIHIKALKEEILKDIIKKYMENILEMVNQKIQDALKKFQNTKKGT